MKTYSPQELREIDAKVAEIMGIEFPCHCGDAKKNHTWHHDYVAMNTDFFPTTDPAAAMQVLKWCVEWGDIVSGVDEDGFWFEHYGTKELAEAPTLELAICLFALKLKGVEV